MRFNRHEDPRNTKEIFDFKPVQFRIIYCQHYMTTHSKRTTAIQIKHKKWIDSFGHDDWRTCADFIAMDRIHCHHEPIVHGAESTLVWLRVNDRSPTLEVIGNEMSHLKYRLQKYILLEPSTVEIKGRGLIKCPTFCWRLNGTPFNGDYSQQNLLN